MSSTHHVDAAVVGGVFQPNIEPECGKVALQDAGLADAQCLLLYQARLTQPHGEAVQGLPVVGGPVGLFQAFDDAIDQVGCVQQFNQRGVT